MTTIVGVKISWSTAILIAIGAAGCSGSTQSTAASGAGAGGAKTSDAGAGGTTTSGAGAGGAKTSGAGGVEASTGGAGATGAVNTAGTSGQMDAASGASGGATVPQALGSPCVSVRESDPKFPGFGVNEVNIETGAMGCSSTVCVIDHFRGRASCPYGQSETGGGCFLPYSSEAVTAAVEPQLDLRKAAIASTCSCHCAGNGPGPYCTCSAGLVCRTLVDGTSTLAGSYCIPIDSEYDPNQPAADCVPPNCGPARPY